MDIPITIPRVMLAILDLQSKSSVKAVSIASLFPFVLSHSGGFSFFLLAVVVIPDVTWLFDSLLKVSVYASQNKLRY